MLNFSVLNTCSKWHARWVRTGLNDKETEWRAFTYIWIFWLSTLKCILRYNVCINIKMIAFLHNNQRQKCKYYPLSLSDSQDVFIAIDDLIWGCQFIKKCRWCDRVIYHSMTGIVICLCSKNNYTHHHQQHLCKSWNWIQTAKHNLRTTFSPFSSSRTWPSCHFGVFQSNILLSKSSKLFLSRK